MHTENFQKKTLKNTIMLYWTWKWKIVFFHLNNKLNSMSKSGKNILSYRLNLCTPFFWHCFNFFSIKIDFLVHCSILFSLCERRMLKILVSLKYFSDVNDKIIEWNDKMNWVHFEHSVEPQAFDIVIIFFSFESKWDFFLLFTSIYH